MQLGPNFKLGTLMLIVVFAVSAVALYGGSQLVDKSKTISVEAGTDAGPPGPPGGPVSVKLVAKNTLFDKRTISASPGSQMTVDLDNEDAGVLHNIAFYTNRTATTKIAASNPTAGVATEEVKFSAPSAPGNYFFRCDVHPDTMNGTFTVR